MVRQRIHFQHRGFPGNQSGLRLDAISGDKRVFLQDFIQRLRQLPIVTPHEVYRKSLETPHRMLGLGDRAKQEKPRDGGLVKCEFPGADDGSLGDQEDPHLRLFARLDLKVCLKFRENLGK